MGIIPTKVGIRINRFFSIHVRCTNYLDIETNSTFVIMSALALITILNILGIKKVKAFQTPVLALTTILILVICFMQLFDASFDFSRPVDGAFDVSKNDPVLLAEAAALVFVAYAGIYKAGALGGEIKEPKELTKWYANISAVNHPTLCCCNIHHDGSH